MTAILKIITKYCNKVDDIRLNELAVNNRPLWARQMWGYLEPALARFNIPPTTQTYLFGTETHPQFTAPTYNGCLHVVDTDKTESFTVSLGNKFKNFELFNAEIQTIDDFANIELKSANNICTYNKTDGTVTIHATANKPIPKGSVFQFDVFNDGNFVADLTREEMQIIGYCFQVEWQERFNETWLDIAPKVDDKTFSEQNRANKMRADTERFAQLNAKLNSAMRRYAQNKKINEVMNNNR